MPPTLFQVGGKTKKQGCHLMRWRPKAPPRTPLHLSPDTSLGPEAEEEDERDRADLRGWGGWRRWERTGNGFQEQIEGVGQRKAEILTISLVPWASKHPLAFSKIALVSVLV